MAKSLAERQTSFRIKSKAQGGMRLDMWLPSEEADKLRKLMAWSGKTGPKVFLDLINNAWKEEVKRAARGGRTDAQFEYAMLCIKGNLRINHKQHDTAKSMFKSSARKGYREGIAYNNLGVLTKIHPASDDTDNAVKYFQLSATHGNRVAYYNLGVLYETGDGLEKDYSQAAAWLLKSAEQDFSPAQQNLGVLYALGKGVPQDHAKAIEYLQKGTGKDAIACQAFLAQVLSTFPDDEYDLRDGHIATKIAENLIQSRRSIEHLYTLAAAYAEAERFDDSITIQNELLSTLKQKKSLSRTLLSIHQDNLKRYESKNPLRDHSLSFGLEYDES